MGEIVLGGLAQTPWWGWLVAAGVLVVLVCAVLWGIVRAIRRWVARRRARLVDRAHGDVRAQQRESGVRSQDVMSWLVTAQFVIAMSLSGWGMAQVAREAAGIPEPVNWLLFAVFEGFALVIMTMIHQRANEGLPYPGLLAGYWAVIGLAAFFVSTHGHGLIGRMVWASITLLAGCTYALRMAAKRRDQERRLREAAGRWQNRRLSLVRWARPVERIKVALELASDEELSADEATARVRERTARFQHERRVQAARDAVWRLGQAKEEPWPQTERAQLRAVRREQRLERAAQKAMARAGLASDPRSLAELLAELQVMELAGDIATAHHSPEQARAWAENLITVQALEVPELAPALEEAEGEQGGDFGFGSNWWGELAPARIGADGRIVPDPEVEAFVHRSDPWEWAVPEPDRGGPNRSEESGSGPTLPDPVKSSGGPVRSVEATSGADDRSGPGADQSPARSTPVDPVRSDPVGQSGRGRTDPEHGQGTGSDQAELVESEKQTGPVIAGSGRTEPGSGPGQEEAGPDRTEEPTRADPVDPAHPDQTGPAAVETGTGSGRWRVKALKGRPGPERRPAIRPVGGSSGPHRTMDELKEDMRRAVSAGELDRNTVDAIVEVLRTGKPRARKLRAWAAEERLFDYVKQRQPG
ncbi:DUF2637 domain-containing protein [Nocardiopsis sp. FR26]|uniref:DUF2637 domain-containing protein n=1 Tax=Nocardiopsis sp. FR26 TaxID=2605987 RepID=UPI0013589BAD|nr:DUF2637 domain-containing protein [Nocardiopsis sp. FR26]